MRFMLLIVVVAASIPADAAAQEEASPGDTEPSAVPRADEDAARDVELDTEEARTRFRLARLHFERGRFAEAARGFEAAHAIAPRSELLFNVYLSWRDAGESGRAAAALRQLLEQPELPPSLSRELLEARRDALEQTHGERRALEQRVEVQERQLREARERNAPASSEMSAGARTWDPGWVLFGGGAVLAAVGAITGGVALSLYDDITARCTGGVCPPDTDSDRATGQALALTTDVLLPLGVLVAATGLVLALVIDEGRDESVSAACTGEGCLIVVGGAL